MRQTGGIVASAALLPCGKRQQRRARTEEGTVAATAPIRVERTRVTIVGITPAVEPRTTGIHEARDRPAPGPIEAGDRLDSSGLIGSGTTAGFKGADVIVVVVLR